MPIVVQCSGCSAKFNAPDKMAGQQANCPKCGNLLLIGLERIREKSTPATSMEPARAAPASSEKPPAPPQPKPAASSKPADPAKPPLIGAGMRRVLVILGVVAAILVLLSQVIAPLINSFRHDSQPEQQTAAAPSEAELAAAQERERKAAKTKVKKPAPVKPWDPLDPTPTEVDPIGGKLVDVPFVLPPGADPEKHFAQRFPRVETHEMAVSEILNSTRHIDNKNLELDWDGHRLGMTLQAFKQMYAVPAVGLPAAYLLTSDMRTPEERRREPRAELHEQAWHVDANIVIARLVMPQDDPALKKYMEGQKKTLAKERLYCFIDERLCFIRYISCTKEERAARAAHPGYDDARLPATANELIVKGFDLNSKYSSQLHGIKVYNYRNDRYEHLECLECYEGGRKMLLARDLERCAELNRRRLAAEKLADSQ